MRHGAASAPTLATQEGLAWVRFVILSGGTSAGKKKNDRHQTHDLPGQKKQAQIRVYAMGNIGERTSGIVVTALDVPAAAQRFDQQYAGIESTPHQVDIGSLIEQSRSLPGNHL